MIIDLPKLGPVEFDNSMSDEEFHKELTRLSDKYDFDLPGPDKHGILTAFKSGFTGWYGAAEKGIGHTFNIPGLEKAGEKDILAAEQQYEAPTAKQQNRAWEQGLLTGAKSAVEGALGPVAQGFGRYAVPTVAGGAASFFGPEAGIAAFAATDYPANFGENVRQQQQVNPNKPVDELSAHAAALGQTALDRFGLPGTSLLPASVKNAFGASVKDVAKEVASGAITHEAGLAKLGGAFGPYFKNIASNYAGLVSMGVGDEALRRAQAGQDFMGPDAIESYKAQLAGATVPAAIFGGIGGFREKGANRTALDIAKGQRADAVELANLQQQHGNIFGDESLGRIPQAESPQSQVTPEGPTYTPHGQKSFDFYHNVDLFGDPTTFPETPIAEIPPVPNAPIAVPGQASLGLIAPRDLPVPVRRDFLVTPTGEVRTPTQDIQQRAQENQARRQAAEQRQAAQRQAEQQEFYDRTGTGPQGDLFSNIGSPVPEIPEALTGPETPTPAGKTVIDESMLRQAGLNRRSNFFNPLLGKDLTKTKDQKFVAQVVENIRNSTLSKSTKDAVENIYQNLFSEAAKQRELFGPKGGIKKEAENGTLRNAPDTVPDRESVPVYSEPESRGTTAGTAAPETGRVGATAKPIVESRTGKENERTTLKEEPVAPKEEPVAPKEEPAAPKEEPAAPTTIEPKSFEEHIDDITKQIFPDKPKEDPAPTTLVPEAVKAWAKNKPEGAAPFSKLSPQLQELWKGLHAQGADLKVFGELLHEQHQKENEIGFLKNDKREPGAGTVDRTKAEAMVNNLKQRFPGLDINYVHNISELSPAAQAWLKENKAEGARGYLTGDGKRAFIIGSNHDTLGEVKATVFHEALGHYGLRKKFRENLDSALMDIYNKNKTIKDAADKWLDKNPDDYIGPDRVARAVDEVLAERSEAGPKMLSAYQKLKNVVRNFLRKIKLIDKYSDSDVDAILADAHKLSQEQGSVGTIGAAAFRRGEDQHPMDNITSNDPSRIQTGFRQVGETLNKLPGMDTKAVNGVKNWFSNIQNDGVRRAVLMTQRLEAIGEMFPELPQIKQIADLMARKQGNTDKHITEAETIYKRALKAAKANPEAQKRLDTFAEEARFAGVDVLNPKESEKDWRARTSKDEDAGTYQQYSEAYDKLKQQFENKSVTPSEMQQTYKDFRGYYEKMMDEYEKVLFGDENDPGAAGVLLGSTKAKLKSEFEAKRMRIKGYIPLMRFGDWVAEYTDPKTGERAVSQFESFRERENFVKQLNQPDTKLYKRIEDISYRSGDIPPDSFIGKVITDMKQQNAPDHLIDAIYQSYLLQFPAQSIAKRFMRSENVRGVDPLKQGTLLLRGFSNTAPQWARKLSNGKYNSAIARAHDELRTFGRSAEATPAQATVASHVNAQAQLQFDPAFAPWVHNATALSGFEYIGGNVSSAVVHFTHVPMVVYPMLGARHGFDKSFTALTDAFKAVNKGIENNPRYSILYKELQDKAQIDHSTYREIIQNRNASLDNMGGATGKIAKILAYPFTISEKYTRRVTAVAAYELALKEKMEPAEAARYATDQVIKAHTAGIAGTAPSMMQHPLGRIFFTFKQFVWNTSSMFARAFHQAISSDEANMVARPELGGKSIRQVAQRQMIGMLAMATGFAGMKGLPFYGAAETTANMINALFGDDEPYDFNESVKQFFGETAYKGLPNKLLNTDIASRVAYGQDLLFRDDPRMISQDGYVLWAMKNLMGPSGSYAANVEQSLKHFNDGHPDRAIEGMLPNFIKNPMKGIRYATEGATTIKGDPIQEDISTYNALMQAAGFAPADLSIKQETAAAVNLYQQKVKTERHNIQNLYVLGVTTGNDDLVQKAIDRSKKFNDAHPDWRLKRDQLNKAVLDHRKAMRDSVDGVRFNPKLSKEAKEKYDLE